MFPVGLFCFCFLPVLEKNKQKYTGNIESIAHSMKTKTNKAHWQHWEHNTQYEGKNKENTLATLRT
jgi:hypothetical protein